MVVFSKCAGGEGGGLGCWGGDKEYSDLGHTVFVGGGDLGGRRFCRAVRWGPSSKVAEILGTAAIGRRL